MSYRDMEVIPALSPTPKKQNPQIHTQQQYKEQRQNELKTLKAVASGR